MKKLENKIALVPGGTGGVGEGIVKSLLAEGATVIVPSRRQERLDELRGRLGDLGAGERLVTIVGDLGTTAGAEALRDGVLERFGRIDVVVPSINGDYSDNRILTELPLEVWERVLRDNLTSHFITAQTFLPVLAKAGKGSYVFIGGQAADQPAAHYGPVCVAAAAQLMMARVMIEEYKGKGVRIYEFILGMVNTRARSEHGRAQWITPEEVGAYAALVASDDADAFKGGVVRLYEGR
jgi:3-oxoacyl-[acyl-carrier protein] reductase